MIKPQGDRGRVVHGDVEEMKTKELAKRKNWPALLIG